MKRGRKALADPPIGKEISLPSSLVAEVELRLYDPTTGKAKYGAFAQLVEALLRQWLMKGAPSADTLAGKLPNDPSDGPAPPNRSGEDSGDPD